MRMLTVLTLLVAVRFSAADDAVRLTDRSGPGTEFRVVTSSTISGELLTPVAKDKPAERIKIAGRSSIDYVERVLPVEVTINRGSGGIWPIVSRDGVLYAPVEAFAQWRMQVRPDTAAELRAQGLVRARAFRWADAAAATVNVYRRVRG